MRVPGGDNPLDASAVHPESYPVVEKILVQYGRDIAELIGDSDFLRSLSVESFVDQRFGEPTIKDIFSELEKPGRDPRPDFKTAVFREGVEKLQDLEPGMVLEGVVTNVANFGAFVDVGVHQDGLVHISALADRFVSDPHAIVKAGDLVKVKVLEVDPARKRISLTMRLSDASARPTAEVKEKKHLSSTSHPPKKTERSKGRGESRQEKTSNTGGGALAEAFARAKKRG